MFLSLLQLLVNRTKRKRRRKRVEKGAALTGSERVKVIDIRTGKKVRENSFGNSAIITISPCLDYKT